VRDRIFHWAKLHETDKWLACGWVFVPANAAIHHHDYSFLMEWLCECPIARPIR
jgi:hypothetical protein